MVIVDPDPGTFNISVDAVRKPSLQEQKLIVPVHLFGQCADMERIMELAGKYNFL